MLYSDLVEDIETLETYVTDGYTRAVLKRSANAIEKLQRQIDGWIEQERKALLKSVPKWIPVTERLPEERTDVLAITADCDIYVCDFIPSVRQFWTIPGDDLHIDDITHWMPLWMPLPEPPKEETE